MGVHLKGENEIYNLPPGSLKHRILNIYGKKYVEDLIPLEQDTEVGSNYRIHRKT